MQRRLRQRLPVRQRGLALIILLALITMAAAFMLVNSLSQGSNALALARAAKNRAALQEARAALVMWAASESLQGASVRLGALPCPDRNNDGIAESSCTSANRLGRLPYKTLGIQPLYDASGELLWYGLAGNFRTTSTINSDTAGQLFVYARDAQGNEVITQSGLVAVLLAPGMRLGTQNRGWTGASCSLTTDPCNIASNFLEGRNGDTTTTDYVDADEDLTNATVSRLFNDQLLAVTTQDLMSVVEPVVAARIQRDLVAQFLYNSDPTLTDSANQWSDDSSQRNKSRYYDAWGGFPFAAPFASPPTTTVSPNYTGQATPTRLYEGLMPLVSNLSYAWTSGSGTVVQTGGTGTITGTSCTLSPTTSDMRCSITWSGGQPTFRMSGTIPNVGRSFVQLARLSDVSTSGGSITARTLSGSLTSAGAGIVSLDATLPSGSGTISVTINDASVVTSPIASTGDPYAGWFNSNRWFQQTYYAVSTGFAPGGGGSCAPGGSPLCLTVSNLTTTPNDDKRAILILAGRSINGSSRPSGTLGNYLEGQNAATGNYLYEHALSRRSSTGSEINDKVVVIAP